MIPGLHTYLPTNFTYLGNLGNLLYLSVLVGLPVAQRRRGGVRREAAVVVVVASGGFLALKFV